MTCFTMMQREFLFEVTGHCINFAASLVSLITWHIFASLIKWGKVTLCHVVPIHYFIRDGWSYLMEWIYSKMSGFFTLRAWGGVCGGTTQNNWVRVYYSLLLGNADPNIALTGSSSSEASIKATLIWTHRQHSHESEPRDYNIDHLIYLRVAAED